MDIHLMYSLLFSLLAVIVFLLLTLFFFNYIYELFMISKHDSSCSKSYSLFGMLFSFIKNRNRAVLWTSELFQKSSSATITFKGPFGKTTSIVLTISPANIKHMLKTRLDIYRKDPIMQFVFSDLLGEGLLLVDHGEIWKTQRNILSHIFYADKMFRGLVKSVTANELSARLIPFFSTAAVNKTCNIDLQDIFHRFTFDILCQVAFGHDPKYLLPSHLPDKPLIDAFEIAIKISMNRLTSPSLLWKTKKILNVGSEKNLRNAIDVLREYVKKRNIGKIEKHSSSIDERGGDFFDRSLKRTLKCNNIVVNEKFAVDSGINIILAGHDTLFSALVWFFWLVSSHPDVEKEIIKEILEVKEDNDLNAMVYTHASICESMRLYPPVPLESKQVIEDDVWPDGTKLKKGTCIFLHVLAMGRSKELWGSECEDFRPERWLVKESSSGNWKFVPRDPFTYPVFHAGPRTCVGKEIAFMQIKMVAASVLKRFRLIPAQGFTPIYNSSLTSKMKTGFPVQIVER